MNEIINVSLSRRQFLTASAIGTSAFILGIPLFSETAEAKGNQASVLNAFIGLDENGIVTFQNPFIEMGQGTYTSIPTIMAEEMDVDMSDIKVAHAPPGKDYKIMINNTMRFTGGSMSVRASYDTMRKVGATARAMLIAAAAQRWKVKPEDCSTSPGMVINTATGKKLSYGKLAKMASMQDVPSNVKLKDPANFRLIGKSVKRTDALAKATGAAEFGVDIKVKNMLYAAIKHVPEYGGSVISVDKAAALKQADVVAVEQVPNGVAVIAKTYWAAKKAVESLPITCTESKTNAFSSEAYLKSLLTSVDQSGEIAEKIGDAKAAMENADKAIEAVYHVPFIAHVTMEPMNCTALVTKDKCTLWAPNQGVDFVVDVAAKITGLKPEAIEVHTPFLGGGFGRRFVLDYVAQAVTLANLHKGKPIKLIWSREEDIQRDHFRPMAVAKFCASFDDDGKPSAWHVTTVGEGPMERLMPIFLRNPKLDSSVFEGTTDQPYDIPNKLANMVKVYAKPVPICFWRSVGHSQNAFFKESFVDEMAHAVNVDPVEFRRHLLDKKPRFKKVLDTVVKMSNWKAQAWQVNGSKHALGVALHESFNSIVAEVAEVTIKDDAIKVVNVWCAIDCGFAVNPQMIQRQMQSGIVYGLSAAMGEEIKVEKGRAVQSNFDTYPLLRLDQMPMVHVEIINSGEKMGGVGEPGTPPIAPAVCNAIFALTGKRIRSLPLSQHTFNT